MRIFALFAYLLIGILTHLVFKGSDIEWSSVSSLFLILGWPLVTIAFFLIVGAAIAAFLALQWEWKRARRAYRRSRARR